MHGSQVENDSEMAIVLQKCKKLARAIKASRVPSFTSMSIGKSIPSREVADVLIDGYLRTFETVYRVLHIPTFRADYERYWAKPQDAKTSFVVVMQLCMAIGACFYDEAYSLRVSATRWIYEALVWLMLPPDKSRMTIEGIQVCDLLNAYKAAKNAGDK